MQKRPEPVKIERYDNARGEAHIDVSIHPDAMSPRFRQYFESLGRLPGVIRKQRISQVGHWLGAAGNALIIRPEEFGRSVSRYRNAKGHKDSTKKRLARLVSEPLTTKMSELLDSENPAHASWIKKLEKSGFKSAAIGRRMFVGRKRGRFWISTNVVDLKNLKTHEFSMD